MKKAIFIICLLMVVLNFGGCVTKAVAYLDGKKNEKLALEYVSDTYGIDAKVISKFAGDTDFIAGRSTDEFIMKESSDAGFPFKIMVYEREIQDRYPWAFMGNEISKDVSQYLQEEYSEAIDSMKCYTNVETRENELLTDMAKINRLPDRYIDISLYLVSAETMDVQQDILCSAYQYLQEMFDDFKSRLYFLDTEGFQKVEEHFSEDVTYINILYMLDIQPLSSFEYYKGSGVKDLESEEIISMFEVFDE